MISDGIIRSRYDIALDGMAVFQFSLREVPPNVRELLAFSGKALEELDYFIFHQANKLMNESIRKKLGIPADKHPYSMDVYGNTSSASIPVTINHAIREDISTKKLNLLLAGFGVGLSWGSVVLEAKDVVCPEIIEVG